MKIRIATRKSRLALVQTRWVASEIQRHNPGTEVEESHIVTQGDKIQDRPLREVGGKGLFVSEVEAALVRGEAELAVHSLKDVPGDVGLADGMDLLCLPPRETAQDWLLTADGRELFDLDAGSRVGTTSLRRICQLRRARPDLAFVQLRGNVDTRLARLDAGDFDAIVLAGAGLKRLGLDKHPHWVIPTQICLPAVGQGTLALEGRVDDEALRTCLAPLEDSTTRVVTTAERAFLLALQGNCHAPIAGYASFDPSAKALSFEGLVGSEDTDLVLTAGAEEYFYGRTLAEHCSAAETLGRQVAQSLIERGAKDLMAQALSRAEGEKVNPPGNRWN